MVVRGILHRVKPLYWIYSCNMPLENAKDIHYASVIIVNGQSDNEMLTQRRLSPMVSYAPILFLNLYLSKRSLTSKVHPSVQ